MARTNEIFAQPIVHGIVQAGNTDGYAVIDLYEDGSESTAWGWFSTRESVYERLDGDGIEIEDWTGEDD